MSTLSERVEVAVTKIEDSSDIAEKFADASATTEFNTPKGPVKPIGLLQQEADAAIARIAHFTEEAWVAGQTYTEKKIYFVHNGIAYNPVVIPYTAGQVDIQADIDAGLFTVLQGLTQKDFGLEPGKIPTSDLIPDVEFLAEGALVGRRLKERFSDVINAKDFGLSASMDSSQVMIDLAGLDAEVTITDGEYLFDQPAGVISAVFKQTAKSSIPDGINLLPSMAHPDKGTVGIERLWGRKFVGKACISNGKYQGTTMSGTGPGWAERDAQFASASASGLVAIFGNSKSSDQPDYHESPVTMGVGGGIVNDKPGAYGWALYGDVRREAGAGGTFGAEIAVKNRGDDVTRRAYSKSYGALGIWLAAGGDPSYQGAPLNPSNVALAIGRNGHTWNRGIVFDSDGFTGCDGVTGTAVIVEMAKGHVLLWSTPLNVNGFTIRSEVDDGEQGINVVARNKSFDFTNSSNKIFGRHSYEGESVNYLELNATPAGVGCRLIAEGDDTDVDIRIEPKGEGVVDIKSPVRIGGGAVLHSGEGSPEGVLAAPVGSIYSRIDGAVGSVLYVKELGGGVTGWVAK